MRSARHRALLRRHRSSIVAGVALLAGRAWAGPPFLTDDPQPVPLHHWELYVASQSEIASHGGVATLPHLETNYGAAPDLQLHVIVPAVLAWSSGSNSTWGLGDVEIGAKYRFLGTDETFQLGTFPLVDLPTGSQAKGLGAGEVRVFLPVWLQDSFGDWLTYGGGAVTWTSGGHDALTFGWLVQRQVVKPLAIGGEAYATFPLDGEHAQLQLDLGLILDLSEHTHLLASGGPSFGSDGRAQGYLAVLSTW
jgi:hypothetical protein